MIIEHIAIWTDRPEVLRDYYTRYFGGWSGKIYHNQQKQFRSFFIEFGTGSRLEIMSAPRIPENRNDTVINQHRGIIHIAFGAASEEEVDAMAGKLEDDGFRILDGPRKTGDGYYEFVTLDPDLNRIEVTTGKIFNGDEGPGKSLSLVILDTEFAICRLDAAEPFPRWAEESEFLSLTRSLEELSVVCRSDRVPAGIISEKGWRALRVGGLLHFGMTGVISSLTSPLAKHGISVFAISTYDTDYLMVRNEVLTEAIGFLGQICKIT